MSELENEQAEPDEQLEPALEPDEIEQEESEEPVAEPEADPSAPQPEPLQDVEMEKAFSKIERSFGTYKAAVERNLEEQITDWLGCPLCYGGAVPGYFNRHDIGHVPDEIAANVKMVLGFARETDYEAAPGIVACTDCGGLGKVSTGSRVAEHMTITCPTCKGFGYTPPPGITSVGNGFTHTAEEHVAAALSDIEQVERDNWGEPRVLPDGTLNDNFGKMPQFKSVHPVYGVTANLSPEELALGDS